MSGRARGPHEIVLTAANRGQAIAMLRTIRGDPRLAEAVEGVSERRAMAVPDRGGRRVGSGIATLAALDAVLERLRRRGEGRRARDPEAIAAGLAGRTIAIVHSGGDSRRLPAYAAEGKLFAPMPDARSSEASPTADGAPTLLERIVGDLDSIGVPEAGGVMIASGDVWLDVDSQDLRFAGDRPEIVAFRESAQRGTRHGVLAADRDGVVERCLQKPSLEAMRGQRCIDDEGRVLLDSGLLFVPAKVVASWLAAARSAGLLKAGGPPLDLYADLLPATAREWLLPAGLDLRIAKFLRQVREETKTAWLRVLQLERCAFRHAGSTRELLAEATADGREAFRRDETLAEDSTIAAGAFVDRCGTVRASLAADAVLVGVLEDPGCVVELPEGRGIVVVPLRDGSHAAIAFASDDDFKRDRDAGGTVLGRPLRMLDDACWADGIDDRTLWTARIWPVGKPREVVRRALAAVEDPAEFPRDAGDGRSAAEIFAMVDHRRLVAERRDARVASLRRAFDREPSPLARARIARRLADLDPTRGAAESWRRSAFAAVAGSVLRTTSNVLRHRAAAASASERVIVRAPARIDLAGGWTDTPPICTERGGAVVNVAVEVDGEPPLEVSVSRLAAPVVRVESRDLGRSAEFTDLASLLRPGDPRDADDWGLLPRTAIAVSGVLGEATRGDLRRRLDRVGGGFELRLASRLPKGSGLGTSSILGASTLAALRRFSGDPLDREGLIAGTSELEQRMGTAGGWQDQAGGSTGGAKLLETRPGEPQVPRETPLTIPRGFWRDRVLVHSTGRQRLARNILQQVVWRWLGGGRRILGIVERIHATAIAMRDAIERGDEDAIAGLVGEAWRLKCELDPGSTTAEIEAMVAPVAGDLSAWALPGAGGGGFLFMVTRDAAAADRVRDRCRREPLHPGGRLHEVTIATKGLRESFG